jgi:hypothetical protein
VFQRAFRAEFAAYGRFDFGLIQRVRDNVCPEASYESTLHACHEAYDRPCLLVRVDYGLSKPEQDALCDRQTSFLSGELPMPQLRAISAHGNEAARKTGLRLHRNMRVPASSHLYRAYQERSNAADYAHVVRRENLTVWEHSDGRKLPTREVTVYTRAQGDGLQALLVDEVLVG